MSSEVDAYLGKVLRRRRLALGLTQKEVGARVGLRLQQIQRYECGATSIGAIRLLQLAQALGLRPSDLFDGLAAVMERTAALRRIKAVTWSRAA